MGPERRPSTLGRGLRVAEAEQTRRSAGSAIDLVDAAHRPVGPWCAGGRFIRRLPDAATPVFSSRSPALRLSCGWLSPPTKVAKIAPERHPTLPAIDLVDAVHGLLPRFFKSKPSSPICRAVGQSADERSRKSRDDTNVRRFRPSICSMPCTVLLTVVRRSCSRCRAVGQSADGRAGIAGPAFAPPRSTPCTVPSELVVRECLRPRDPTFPAIDPVDAVHVSLGTFRPPPPPCEPPEKLPPPRTKRCWAAPGEPEPWPPQRRRSASSNCPSFLSRAWPLRLSCGWSVRRRKVAKIARNLGASEQHPTLPASTRSRGDLPSTPAAPVPNPLRSFPRLARSEVGSLPAIRNPGHDGADGCGRASMQPPPKFTGPHRYRMPLDLESLFFASRENRARPPHVDAR